MAEDPLYQALGLKPDVAAHATPRRSVWILMIVVALAAGAGATALMHQREGSRPAAVAVVPIETAPKPAPLPPAAASTATSPPAAAAAPAGESVEIQHGVKIIRLGQAASSASVAIPVQAPGAVTLPPAPDPRLVETTRFGPLPRIGADGARPAAVYARPAAPPSSGLAGAPRIALVVAGMGQDQAATAQAARLWPPTVTFAFPPDGPDLTTQVAETRAAGHEVILQLPPSLAAPAGPQDEAPADRLHRLMGRFSGYAGASLPGGDPALRADAARELGARGVYLLDAAQPSSAATPLAETGPRGIDVTLGSSADPAALGHLVARARAAGTAIGWIDGAGAGPAEVTALASQFAQQHVDLVPLSALAAGGQDVPRTRK